MGRTPATQRPGSPVPTRKFTPKVTETEQTDAEEKNELLLLTTWEAEH